MCAPVKVPGSFLAFSALHYQHTELQPAQQHIRETGESRWREERDVEKIKELTMSKTETNGEEEDGDRM